MLRKNIGILHKIYIEESHRDINISEDVNVPIIPFAPDSWHQTLLLCFTNNNGLPEWKEANGHI